MFFEDNVKHSTDVQIDRSQYGHVYRRRRTTFQSVEDDYKYCLHTMLALTWLNAMLFATPIYCLGEKNV